MPLLASEGFIKPNGQIWLPNLSCVTESLNDFNEELGHYFIQSQVTSSQATRNPLFLATESVEEDLLKCPDKLNNTNQIEPILKHSECVFICLTYNNYNGPIKSTIKRSLVKTGSLKRIRLDKEFPSSDESLNSVALAKKHCGLINAN